MITHVCKRFIDAILRQAPEPALNAAAGWALAALALAAGYVGYGWPGVLLALSVIVFWLLMQFSRALRTMRRAAGRPVGLVDSAVMLHAGLHLGMRLPQILLLTRSLGRRLDESRHADVESYAWRDSGGDEVVVDLKGGQLTTWRLQRSKAPP